MAPRPPSSAAASAPDGTLSEQFGPDGRPAQVWWHCLALDGSRPAWFAVVWSDRYADGERVELPLAEAERTVGDDAVATAFYDEHGRVGRLQVGRRGAPLAPPLWFAEVRESTARPPAVSLMAFEAHAGFGVPAGGLLDTVALAQTPVTGADQLAAVRWYPATGEVDQVYVQPEHRRRSLSGAMIGAAAALSYARDWPRLWGDGQRTALGEQLRNASPWRHRAADLTHVAPPMTPGDESV